LNKLKNSKILITGGAGFIGSNLVEYFLKNNNKIVCLDNLSTGYRDNISEFFNHPNFQFLEGDIRNLDTCKIAIKDCKYVFHKAALGSVPRSLKDPKTTNSVNIDGFLNVLTASRHEGVKRFIYASSSSVYGDYNETSYKIEEKTGRPLSPYAITKVVNEYFAKVYSELYGIESIGLRYFNVFGKRQDPNGAYAAVIPLWVKSLLDHQSPTINGDSSISRDFTFIDNVIQANELAAITPTNSIQERLKDYYDKDKEHEKKQTVMDVFNVACGNKITLNTLFEELRCNLSKFDQEINKIEVEIGLKREGDIYQSMASIEKIKLVLGYQPNYNAKEGLKIACDWYYQNLKQII
jgi:UDP-N-acetylglucosamine 4-epimerase